jgi:hypothetical protein
MAKLAQRIEQDYLTALEKRQSERQKVADREVCASLASENIPLQNGEYVTGERLDELRESILNYNFRNRGRQ